MPGKTPQRFAEKFSSACVLKRHEFNHANKNPETPGAMLRLEAQGFDRSAPKMLRPVLRRPEHLSVSEWCREGELNPQGAKHRRILSPLRLPVPPSRRWRFLFYCKFLQQFSAGNLSL